MGSATSCYILLWGQQHLAGLATQALHPDCTGTSDANAVPKLTIELSMTSKSLKKNNEILSKRYQNDMTDVKIIVSIVLYYES